MASHAPNTRELARRLVARSSPRSDAPDGAAMAAHAACEHTYRELTRTLGGTGSRELLIRAVAQARTEYPFVAEIRIGHDAGPGLDGVKELVRAHGDADVAAALELVLDRLLALLGRLIGDDMVVRLVGQSGPIGMQDDERAK